MGRGNYVFIYDFSPLMLDSEHQILLYSFRNISNKENKSCTNVIARSRGKTFLYPETKINSQNSTHITQSCNAGASA